MTHTFIFNNINELKMNYQKVEYFFEFHNSTNEAQKSINNKMKYCFKKLKEKNKDKKHLKKILNSIKELYYEKDNIYLCIGNTNHMINFLTAYNTQKIKYKAGKVALSGIHN